MPGWVAPSDPKPSVFQICPWPCWSMLAMAVLLASSAPVRLVSTRAARSRSRCSHSGRRSMLTPALLTHTSTPPKASAVASHSAWSWPGSVMSQAAPHTLDSP